MCAGVCGTFFGIAVRSVVHISPRRETELKHTDTRKPAFFDQLARFSGIVSEVFGDHELISRNIFDDLCKSEPRSAPPAALASSHGISGYGKIGFHRAEMVYPYPIEHRKHKRKPVAPEGISVSPHVLPVVKRVSPQLTCR